MSIWEASRSEDVYMYFGVSRTRVIWKTLSIQMYQKEAYQLM
jgi:hypothetical protein